MKNFTKLRLLTLLCFICLGVGNAWGTDYIMTPDQTTTGNTSSSYVTSPYDFTYNKIGWQFAQWNPSSLQIKTNQSSSTSEFYFHNTTAFNGRITKVVIKFKALTLKNQTTTGFKFVGGSSVINEFSGGTDGIWSAQDTTLTWTPEESDNFTYFALYQNGKVASGTNNLASKNAITNLLAELI